MYYALIILSVVMFGGSFALNDVYRKMRGDNLKISLQFSLLTSLAGLIILLAVNSFKLEFTVFTGLMALISALINLSFTFCAFKALGIINLSLYSLFSMLGGMLLPFLQGIIFYDEKMTVAKGICLVLISLALLLTVEKGEKTKGTFYYIGIFVLNGMSGVISKLFTSAPYEKTSATGYSVLSALASVILSIIVLAIFAIVSKKSSEDKFPCPKMKLSDSGVAFGYGALNRVANLLLVIALAHVDASVQYPMVTGGVMIVSTLICFFGKTKPSKKEMLSVLIAFLGMLALFAIPV